MAKYEYVSFLWQIAGWSKTYKKTCTAKTHIRYQSAHPYSLIRGIYLLQNPLTRITCIIFLMKKLWVLGYLRSKDSYQTVWKPRLICLLGAYDIWAMSWENLSYAICKQQRRRPACTLAQSDQRLCCLLPRKHNTSTYYLRCICTRCCQYFQKTESPSHNFSVVNVTLQILNFISVTQLIKLFPIWCNVNFGSVFFAFLYCLMQWKQTQN